MGILPLAEISNAPSTMPDYSQRRQRALASLGETPVDAILVTSEPNVTYLTGFTGDSSYLLLRRDGETLLFTDARYDEQLADECPGLPLSVRRPGTTLPDLMAKLFPTLKVARAGFEASVLTVAALDRFREKVPGVAWVPTTGVVERVRDIKEPGEIEAIRKAVRIAERAFDAIKGSMHPDQTELETAHELESIMRRLGASGCSFPPIIAAGPRAALPHARATDRKLGSDPFVLIDWGARWQGYISDLTRVLGTATIPPKLAAIYEVVLTAQLAAIDAIAPGVPMKTVDAAARNVITAAGYGEQFGHGLGHGIGLEVHEGIRLAGDQERLLEPGMVITVEPGIYIPGFGGVRIEDDILVVPGGREVLSSTPKDFSMCQVSW